MKKRILDMWKKRFHENSGMTLVEVMVTFVLIGIFMTAATFMATQSIRMFTQMRASSDAVTVSDLILDKIAGEIAAANIPEENRDGYYFWLSEDDHSEWVAFENRSESPIMIYAVTENSSEFNPSSVDDAAKTPGGQIYIKYFEMGVRQPEIDWHFASRAYMGYEVTELYFSRPDAAGHPNVIRIDLTLKHARAGFEYSSYRYAECYNFDAKTNNICVRSDGNSGPPERAEEFRIDISTLEPTPDTPTDPDDTPGGDTENPDSVTVIDSSQNPHVITATAKWDDAKQNLLPWGGAISPGTVLSDSTGVYLIYGHNETFANTDAALSLAGLCSKYPDRVMKLESTALILTENDTIDGRGQEWKAPVKAKTLCYWKGTYYITPNDHNQYTFPPGGWIKVFQ